MPRIDGDNMTPNPSSKNRKVADNIDDLVTHEFIGKPQRFFAQDRVAPDHDRVFQTAAFDEVFVHERLDIFVINKGAGRCDLTLVDCRGDLGGAELCELSAAAALST